MQLVNDESFDVGAFDILEIARVPGRDEELFECFGRADVVGDGARTSVLGQEVTLKAWEKVANSVGPWSHKPKVIC